MMKDVVEKNTLKDDLKRDWKTFRSLKGAKRWEFVYDYYRWKILATAFILFVLCLGASILYEGQRYYRLRVCVVLNAEEDVSQPWFRSFTEELTADGAPGAVDINHDQPFDYENSYSYLHELEVMTTISSYRMDVAVCNRDMYSYLLALNACAPLDTTLPEDLYGELQSRGMICHDTAGLQIQNDGSIDSTNAVDGDFGILLDTTAFAQAYDQPEEEEHLYGVIISNTDRLEDSLSLIQALILEE